jgi:hypothetical protein
VCTVRTMYSIYYVHYTLCTLYTIHYVLTVSMRVTGVLLKVRNASSSAIESTTCGLMVSYGWVGLIHITVLVGWVNTHYTHYTPAVDPQRAGLRRIFA